MAPTVLVARSSVAKMNSANNSSAVTRVSGLRFGSAGDRVGRVIESAIESRVSIATEILVLSPEDKEKQHPSIYPSFGAGET